MSEAFNILVVEDDPVIGGAVVSRLRQEGFRSLLVAAGQAAIDAFNAEHFDLVLLDVMLPDIDGLAVCKAIRGISVQVPVIILTGRDAVEDRVLGLDSGADDYIIKPFSFDELIARIRALWRRAQPSRGTPMRFAHLSLDPAAMELRVGNRREPLTVREYAVMELFMKNPNQVLSRAEIFQKAWDQSYRGNSNMVDVYINYLRNKTQAAGEAKVIFTIRGRGYALREPDSAE
jgi:two-component system, OmpR family, response regulator MprA